MFNQMLNQDLYKKNDEYRRAADILFEIESNGTRVAAALDAEVSFRKVWGAITLLSFLYGLMYGVYLSK